MMSGRSGLPKFKQSVTPIGSAPEQTRLRAASAIAMRAPSYGLQQAIAAVAIHRHGQRFVGAFYPHDRRIGTGPHHRIRPHHMIVLLIDPALAADRRRLQQAPPGRHSHL